MKEILLQNLPFILTFIVTIPVVWKYGRRLYKLFKEIEDVVSALSGALADENLTKEEIAKILKELKDVPQAVKNLMNRKKV